jgi:hypothetical protein
MNIGRTVFAIWLGYERVRGTTMCSMPEEVARLSKPSHHLHRVEKWGEAPDIVSNYCH